MKIDKSILMKWWMTRTSVYSIREQNQFERIIDEYGCEKVSHAAVISFMTGDGSTYPILEAMRTGNVSRFFSALPDYDVLPEKVKNIYDCAEKMFIENCT